jgi:hypothetical protein
MQQTKAEHFAYMSEEECYAISNSNKNLMFEMTII